MAAINWTKEIDDNDNTYWEGMSPCGTEEGEVADLSWRLRQRIRADRLEWYGDHDPELLGGEEDTYDNIEDAKRDVQRQHDEIIADAMNLGSVEGADCRGTNE